MAYEKQGFEDGMVLRAEHLTNMEDGIVAAQKAATPEGKPNTLLRWLSYTNSEKTEQYMAPVTEIHSSLTPGNPIGYVEYSLYDGDTDINLDFTTNATLPANAPMFKLPWTYENAYGTPSMRNGFTLYGSDGEFISRNNLLVDKSGYVSADFSISANRKINIHVAENAMNLYPNSINRCVWDKDEAERILDAAVAQAAEWEEAFEYLDGDYYNPHFPEKSGKIHCVGLVSACYRLAGLPLAAVYAEQLPMCGSVVGRYDVGEEIPLDVLQKGDAICWCRVGETKITHVVLYDGEGGYWEATDYFDKMTPDHWPLNLTERTHNGKTIDGDLSRKRVVVRFVTLR